jgi:flagellar biogenesis protein FliO
MDAAQQIIAVCMVLAALGGALWWLRRKGLVQFAANGMGKRERNMQVLERLPLTAQHSLHLVRIEGRVVLVAVAPGGCSILDTSRTSDRHQPETAR